MTLILTIIHQNKTIQVSDCRLTLQREVCDREAIKAVGIVCGNAQFCIGYTGIASIEGLRTDYWLVEKACEIFESGHYGVRSFEWELAVRAEKAMPGLMYEGRRVGNRYKQLMLVLAGFDQGPNGPRSKPFITTISNTKYRGIGIPADVDPIFTINSQTLKPWLHDGEHTGSIVGAIDAIMAEDEYARKTRRELVRVQRLMRRVDLGHVPSGQTTVDELVSVLRRASEHPKYGWPIGRDCLSVVIRLNASTMPVYQHVEGDVAAKLLPHLVTSQYKVVDGIVTYLPQPA